MKQMVTQLCGVALSGLMIFFCLQILFGRWCPFGMAHTLAGQFEDTELVSENGERMQMILQAPVPQVKLNDEVYHTEEKIRIFSCMQVRTEEAEPWGCLAETGKYTAELLDIADQSGRSLGNNVFFGEGEEAFVPDAAAGFTEETGELIFYQSGCYILKFKVAGPYGRTVVKEVSVPVEAK